MSNKKAFSLIEVIVSITIVVAIAGTGSLLVSGYSNSIESNQASIVAAGLAQELLAQSFESRQQKPDGPIEVTYDKTTTLNNITYSRELTIETIEDGSLASGKYWQATARVKWDSAGRQREVVLKTYIAGEK